MKPAPPVMTTFMLLLHDCHAQSSRDRKTRQALPHDERSGLPIMGAMDRREIAEDRAARRGRFLPGWSLLASAGFHGLVALIFVLIALFGFARPPEEEPVLRVTVLDEGPGAAGAAGGAEGGGEPAAAPAAAAPSSEDLATEAPAAEDAPLPVAQPTPLPPKPPKPPRPHHKPPPQHRVTTAQAPVPQPPQLAEAKSPETTEAAPGHGNAEGDASGTGTGAEGAGHGAIGDGPITGPGDDYLDRLRRWLNGYKQYPDAAQQRKEEGELVVSFTILHDGTVVDPRIERSSGFPLLDEAALKMLRDASPVPPLPATYRAERVGIDLPVDFSIGLLKRLF
jgi:protein TonB